MKPPRAIRSDSGHAREPSTAFRLVHGRADDVFGDRDAVFGRSTVIQTGRVPIPLLGVARAVPLNGAAMGVRVAPLVTAAARGSSELGRMAVAITARI